MERLYPEIIRPTAARLEVWSVTSPVAGRGKSIDWY